MNHNGGICLECDYCKKLEKYNFGDYICNTKHWIVFLAPQQSNIGTCVVALNRPAEDLSSLTSEEWTEFGKLVGSLEFSVKQSFGVTMYNWGSLMNASYLEKPPNPHVHWHFIPRYNHEVEFDGLTFEDPYFGTMKPRPFRTLPDKIRLNIIDVIKTNLSDR
jgi:diadenosine tetraphosphate (Ap4A) HIT family hydrolase